MMLLASYFVDDTINTMDTGNTLFMKVLKALNALYRPVARFRLRHGLKDLLVERAAYDLAQKIIAHVTH